jgi:hypothetical protein
MVALFVTVDILLISKLGLNINEYMTLLKYQHDLENKSFPFLPDERFFPRLLEDGFIVDKEGGGFALGPAGIAVFKGDDLFEEFYATFPAKVPTDMGFRPVSTGSVDGVSAKTTRAIWDRVTKNKPHLQRTIIDNLKRELAYRKADGSLGFLQGIDTWLHQATWEKWEDIPDKKVSTGYTKL